MPARKGVAQAIAGERASAVFIDDDGVAALLAAFLHELVAGTAAPGFGIDRESRIRGRHFEILARFQLLDALPHFHQGPGALEAAGIEFERFTAGRGGGDGGTAECFLDRLRGRRRTKSFLVIQRPRLVAADQVAGVVASLGQNALGEVAAQGDLTVDDDFPVFRQLSDTLTERIDRDQDRTRNVACLVFPRRSHIEQDVLLRIERGKFVHLDRPVDR